MKDHSNQSLTSRGKHQAIVAMLKNDIVGGLFPVGSRLPTRKELEERFSVTSNTMQLVMDRLRREGFVVTDGRNGTIVADHPPHLFHYGLVFHGQPGKTGQSWPRFWDYMDRQARELGILGPRKITSYHDIQAHAQSPDFQRLLADIKARRLAGLVFMPTTRKVIDAVLADAPDLPRVGVMSTHEPGMPIIQTEPGFLKRALDYLAGKGRRRIAFVIGPTTSSHSIMQDVDALLAQRGMTSEPYWKFEFHLDLPAPARNYTQMLMRAQAKDRPDALVITDDNLVESATIGIAAAGTRVPEQLDIVAHCNFPWPTPSVVPSHRLGYDVRRILSEAIARLDEMRGGRAYQEVTPIPLQNEEEASGAEWSA